MSPPAVPDTLDDRGPSRWPDLDQAIASGDAAAIEAAASRVFSELDHLVASDPASGVIAATDALVLVDSAGAVDQQVHARRLLAMAYAHTNQFGDALETCAAAERLAGAETVPVEIARIRLASMQPLVIVGRIDEAIQVGQAALASLEANGNGTLAGHAAINLGATLAMTGRPEAALPYFERAAMLLDDEPIRLGQIAANQGTALTALDRFEDAERAFQRAVDLLNTDEMAWTAAIVHGNLADLAARQGAIQRSLRHFEESRRLLERDGAFGVLGRLDAEQASVLSGLRLDADDHRAFTGAIGMLRDHGSPRDLVMAQVAYGSALIAAGSTSEATSLLAEVRDRIDPAEQPDAYRQFIALDAELALAGGHHEAAAALIAAGLATVTDRPVQRLPWLLKQAELARRTGHAEDAGRILTGALETATTARVTPLVAEIHGGLAAIATDRGDRSTAAGHARQAVAAIESIRGTIQANRLRQSFHHGRLDIYAALYRSLIQQADPVAQHEAFGLAERMRSRALQDAIMTRERDVEATVAVDPAEQPLIAELAGHRRWLNWMYSSLADGHEPVADQQDELAERERAAATLSDRLAILRPRPGLDDPRPLEQIQRGLDPDTLILSYLVVDGTVTLQAISSDRIEGVADLARAVEVGELVARLQFQIGRQLASGSAPASASRAARLQRDVDLVLAQLYTMLIGPVEPWLSDRRRLVIIPSGDLHGVPFAALRSGDTYLVDRFTVVTAPGVTVLAAMGEQGSGNGCGAGGPVRPLIVGVPDDTAPGLGREAELLAGRFDGGTTLIGDAATRLDVLAKMADADLIHLACHGRFDPTHPNASGLQMADGWLTLDQLLDIRLDRPLVLLSGCETGRVRVDRGDELVGIMATLIGAGAGGLVTSLWKTQDAAATALIESFYDLWLAGADPVSALRAAQRHVRRTYPHPACWAPFVVATSTATGDNR